MSDVLAVLSWWLIIQVLGLAVWPGVSRWLRWLPDRGYMLAKPIGLLFASYGLWLLATLGAVQNTAGGIIVVVAIVAALSVLGYARGNPIGALRGKQAPGSERREGEGRAAESSLRRMWREQRGLFLAYEIVFAIALIGWALFRAQHPDISTTEKPMELAFFNAINRSTAFPPPDPWLSGYAIAYYYFGYVMMSLLHLVSGVSSGTAYGLSNAFWFALSAASAFGVVANLVLAFKHKAHSAAIAFGVLGSVLLVLVGNFEAPLEVAHANDVGSPQFWQWLDIQEINTPAVQNPPDVPWYMPRPTWWWWRASRVIHDYPPNAISPQVAAAKGVPPAPGSTYQELIDEFPQFSFLLGDMHPHVLALPFALLMMALALNLYLAAARGEVQSLAWGTQRAPWWPLYALAVGSLSFLNTWDFPIYAFVLIAALALGNWRAGHFKWIESGLDLILLGVTGFVLFIPFYRGFSSQAAGIAPNLFNGTRLSQFFIMFAPFLIIGGMFGLALFVETIHARRARALPFIGQAVLGGLGVLLALTAALGALGLMVTRVSERAQTLLDDVINSLAASGLSVGDHLRARLLDPWVPVLLAVSLAAIWLLWRARLPRGDEGQSLSKDEIASSHGAASHSHPSTPTPLRSEGYSAPRNDAAPLRMLSAMTTEVASPIDFGLLLYAIGLLLTLGTEFAFIIDGFGTRMNTVFKFYYQAWALWSVASAFGAYYLLAGSEHIKPIGRAAAGVVIAIVLVLGLIYPTMALQTGTVSAGGMPTLDALAATGQTTPDEYAAVQWFNRFVTGTPVILEAPGEEYNPGTSRISTWTGLPTVVGWAGHEGQWRGSYEIQGPRVDAVKEIYSTGDLGRAMQLLNQYAVHYVVVGPDELRQYPRAALEKFAQILPVVFQQGTVTVYEVP